MSSEMGQRARALGCNCPSATRGLVDVKLIDKIGMRTYRVRLEEADTRLCAGTVKP